MTIAASQNLSKAFQLVGKSLFWLLGWFKKYQKDSLSLSHSLFLFCATVAVKQQCVWLICILRRTHPWLHNWSFYLQDVNVAMKMKLQTTARSQFATMHNKRYLSEEELLLALHPELPLNWFMLIISRSSVNDCFFSAGLKSETHPAVGHLTYVLFLSADWLSLCSQTLAGLK